MGRVEDLLGLHHVIGFDTATFIYHVQSHPRFGTAAAEVLERVARGSNRGVTATITVTEFIVKPLQRGQVGLADAYQAAVTSFPNLVVVPNHRKYSKSGC